MLSSMVTFVNYTYSKTDASIFLIMVPSTFLHPVFVNEQVLLVYLSEIWLRIVVTKSFLKSTGF